MKKSFFLSFIFISAATVFAQKENEQIAKGNIAYKEGQYDKAVNSYKNALMVAPKNAVANFNLANAMFRNSNPEEAEKIFDAAIELNHSKQLSANAWYNKGVSLTNQKKLEESIQAYKQSLRLNSSDTLARENLVRALREQKKNQEKEKEEKKKQEKEKKDQQQKQQPKMNKQQVQQLLQALAEQEKQLQQKMNQLKIPAPSQPDKDW